MSNEINATLPEWATRHGRNVKVGTRTIEMDSEAAVDELVALLNDHGEYID